MRYCREVGMQISLHSFDLNFTLFALFDLDEWDCTGIDKLDDELKIGLRQLTGGAL